MLHVRCVLFSESCDEHTLFGINAITIRRGSLNSAIIRFFHVVFDPDRNNGGVHPCVCALLHVFQARKLNCSSVERSCDRHKLLGANDPYNVNDVFNGQIEAQSDEEQRQTLLATIGRFNAAWITPLLSHLKRRYLAESDSKTALLLRTLRLIRTIDRESHRRGFRAVSGQGP